MKYGTLFSGIEGFGLGFDRAGMTPAFQCEIDTQAAAVLHYHYPEVPRWTDVSEVIPDELPDVDVLAFGSPCQDLSVAGRRAGLDGERSGLFVEAIRIADSLAPDWLVFENVPGLLSSQRGEDFAVALEGITGFRPAVPSEGWRSAGWIDGPLRWAVWRVCDTQFWGPPQRRRRVFVVAGSRGVCSPEVLLEPESVPWDSPPSREAREGVAGGSAGGVGVTGRVAHTLRSRGCDASEDGTGRGTPIVLASGQANAEVCRGHSPTLNLNRDGAPITLYRPSDYTTGDFAEDDRTGALTGMTGQSRGGVVLTPFDTTQITSKGNYSRPKPGDPCHPLAAGAHPPAIAGSPVPRRLTPRECERLQGFPDDWTLYGRTPDGEVYEQADTPRYRQLGNAVSVPVAEWIGRRILHTPNRRESNE